MSRTTKITVVFVLAFITLATTTIVLVNSKASDTNRNSDSTLTMIGFNHATGGMDHVNNHGSIEVDSGKGGDV